MKRGDRVQDIALGTVGTLTVYHPSPFATRTYGEWDYVTDVGHRHSAIPTDLVQLSASKALPRSRDAFFCRTCLKWREHVLHTCEAGEA